LLLAAVSIWKGGPAVHFGGKLNTKLITEKKENEAAWPLSRPFLPKHISRQLEPSNRDWEAQAPSNKGRRGEEGLLDLPVTALPTSFRDRRREEEAGTGAGCFPVSSLRRCDIFSVCSFSLHTLESARTEAWLLVFNVIGLGWCALNILLQALRGLS
jgi:hypothetical protein